MSCLGSTQTQKKHIMSLRTLLSVPTLILIMTIASYAQQIQQTVRGTIIDQDNQMPLIGATVVVVGSNPLIGATTDLQGRFRISGVPVGRVTLKISFIGYEDRTIPNLLIGSAKEEIIDVALIESVSKLEEIVVTGNAVKGEVLNEMA